MPLLLASALLLARPAAEAAGPGTPSGPARGSSARSGVVLPADVLHAVPERTRGALPELEIDSLRDPAGRTPSSVFCGANERDDASRPIFRERGAASRGAALLAGFEGVDDDGVTPPDPIVAAGPAHVIVAVNSSFAIFSKTGAPLFRFAAASWFLPQLSAVGAQGLFVYDPQVAYDHFDGRWILVYVANDARSQSWILLSVSNSSDPTAGWHSWALPGDANGSTPVENFSDRPSLGFDDRALYVATNQFRYADTGFEYARIRVLDKAPLYAGAASATWSDLWDLEDPLFPGAKVNGVRPAITFGHPGVEHLVGNSPFATRDHVTLWTLSGAGTDALAISGADVPVAGSAAPPGADQKGGSPGVPGCPTPCLLNMGGGTIASAVSRNGSLWFAHTVADADGVHSRARYARLDLATKTAREDEAFGADGCWYFYPALAVDAGGNLTMVFGRSCTDAWPGVAATARSIAESALEPSVSVRDGEGSYVVPTGDGELVNRWGDFFGAAPDPADPGRVWMVGEYAGAHRNWRTWVAEKAAPLTSGSCAPAANVLCLGDGRFRATVAWRRADGSTGSAGAAPITDDTGEFWFFDEQNVELVVKVLDGCGRESPHFWVFAGGLTNVAFDLLVEDTVSGASRTYTNAAGTAFPPLQDTAALPCP